MMRAQFWRYEGLALAENFKTLTDDELNVDDALAIVDLLTGLTPKQVSIIQRAKPVTNDEVNEISRVLKNYYKLRDEVTSSKKNGRTATFSTSIRTNKESEMVAKILQYKRTGEINNKGQPILENTKRYPKYIVFSKSSHNGDFFKGYDSIKDAKSGLRNGSYDEFLNRVKK